jgi:hypothetical protein
MSAPKDNTYAKANSKFKEEYIEQARKLCLLGSTDKDLADFFNVCEKTLNNWKHEHSKFLQSLKDGKDIFDTERVEKALLHRALGYSHKEVKTATFEGKITDIVEVDKHYSPDTTALIFWLKNRQPKRWRDKPDIESTNVQFDTESTEEERSAALENIKEALEEFKDYE